MDRRVDLPELAKNIRIVRIVRRRLLHLATVRREVAATFVERDEIVHRIRAGKALVEFADRVVHAIFGGVDRAEPVVRLLVVWRIREDRPVRHLGLREIAVAIVQIAQKTARIVLVQVRGHVLLQQRDRTGHVAGRDPGAGLRDGALRIGRKAVSDLVRVRIVEELREGRRRRTAEGQDERREDEGEDHAWSHGSPSRNDPIVTLSGTLR